MLNFHDETYFNQHHAIIAHLQNGAYPPRYLYEPSLLLRYHYGFDLAAAIVTGLLRIRVDQAIDFVTLAIWPVMFLLLWRLGEHFGGSKAGLFVSLLVCFAGGWPQIGSACPHCSANGVDINPPFISYYFQHPWSIGVPIFCLVVLQRASLAFVRNKFFGVTALACSLALLSLSHAVLFVTTVIAFGLAELWNLARARHGQSVMVLLGLGMSLLIAKGLGGFFLTAPVPAVGGLFSTGLELRDFTAPRAVLGQIQWDLASFGGLLILGSVGLLRVRCDKAFLTILVALALVIVNVLRYQYTWDIIKFGTVGFIALAIGAGVALSDLWGWAGNWGRRTACVLITALLWQGFLYPFGQLSAYDPESRPRFSVQMIRPYFSTMYPVDADNARAVSFLRTHMGASEIAYRSAEKSEPYAI